MEVKIPFNEPWFDKGTLLFSGIDGITDLPYYNVS